MGFFDSLLGGFTDAIQGVGASIVNMTLDPINALMDSLGISRHGRDQYKQMEFSREMMDNQQAFQREMFGLSSDFAREQTTNQQNFTREMYTRQIQDLLKNYPQLMRMQSDNQFNLWRNQFEMQNQYNNPQSQTQRLLAAGINPNSVFGGSGSVATSQMGASSLQQPPIISPTPFNSPVVSASGSPATLPSGYVGDVRSTVSELGSFMRDVAAAKKTNKEIARYDDITDAYIEKLYNDALSSYALASYNGIKTVVQRALGKEYMQSEIIRNLRQAMVYGAQEDTEKALSMLYKAETWLTNSKNEVILEQLPYISTEIQSLINYYRTGAARNQSEVSLNYATADLRKQQKETEKFVTESADWNAKIDRLDYVFQNETQVERLQNFVENARQAGLIADQMEADLNYFIQQRDVRSARELLGLMVDAAEGYSKVGHVKNGSDFNRAYEMRNKIEGGYIDWKKDHSGDTHESFEETFVNARGHRIKRSFSRQRAPQTSE